MPRAYQLTIARTTAIERSARVLQLESLFDLAPTKHSALEWKVDFTLPEKWNIGLIVGPSGSGKTTIARELFRAQICNGFKWDPARSIIDGFPASLGIKEIVRLLSSVGFSSPPSWLRPFHVLSNGEQFRVTMARALTEHKICAIDEFTSVVDRRVAQIGSCAIAKTVRRLDQQFIALSCHYDIVPWLSPDWIYQPHLGKLELPRGSLRRPPIHLEIRRVHTRAWDLFKRHHYLTATLHRAATCFCAFLDGQPIAFDAWLPFFGKTADSRAAKRGSRTVCLPDFQGVGIGNALFTHCASIWKGLGYHVYSCTGHPAEITRRLRSPDWTLTRKPGRVAIDTSNHKAVVHLKKTRSSNRITASFEYIGPAMPLAQARAMVALPEENPK